jgi:hypothetical protein
MINIIRICGIVKENSVDSIQGRDMIDFALLASGGVDSGG